MVFAASCGVILNFTLFLNTMFSSTWVAILSFHLLQQARGKWVEVERYHRYYVAFAFTVLAAAALAMASVKDFRPPVCFSTPREHRILAAGLVAEIAITALFCLFVLVYVRFVQRVQLYNGRYLAAYLICWAPRIAWCLIYLGGSSQAVENSAVLNTICAIGLASLGSCNVVLFGTMPPERPFLRAFARLLRLLGCARGSAAIYRGISDVEGAAERVQLLQKKLLASAGAADNGWVGMARV